MTIQYLEEKDHQLTKKINEMKKTLNLLSLLRFFFMIGVFVDLLIGYYQKKEILYILSVVFLIVFICLVFTYKKINKQLQYHLALQSVYQEHILRISHQWDQFKDDGSLYIKEKDYRSLDLDVFGHHSLFQLMSIAFTNKGRERLSYYLKAHDETLESLKERQDAVVDMSKHLDFVIRVQTYGKLIEKNDEKVIQNFIESIKENSCEKKSTLFKIIPFLSCIMLFCVLFSFGKPYTLAGLELLIFVQIALGFVFVMKHNVIFEPISNLSLSLRSYESIFKLIHKEEFNSLLLLKIQKETLLNGKAIQGINELSKIADRLSYRKNIFALILLNGLGLYDFWMKNQYLSWLDEYQDSIEQWLNGLSEFEVIMSLSVLKIDQFPVTIPKLEAKQTLSFTHLRHPLIPQEKVVGNNYIMNHNVNIITGSNMSGKTTFMRTIGLNLILAYAGGFVFADQMNCSLMSILTSMRVQDNVEEGISTFYGELLRIKEMIDYSKNNEPLICFVDEIFKGTNSLDRIAGAKATVEQLSLSHCMTFLTTHDFELCEMDSVQFDNYHFDEYYKDKQIFFDYHIKEGKSETTNGQFLLKQLGIIKE